jgi:hypothetical protein
MREQFKVTIPNLKEAKDRAGIKASFAGERYSQSK